MKQLYPKPLICFVLIIFFSLTPIFSLWAQCPAGSEPPANNQNYTNGDVVCVSGTFSGSLKLNNGAKMLLISGGKFTGNIDGNPGSVIEVQKGGTFTPSAGSNLKSTLIIAKDGLVTLANVELGSGFSIQNSGSLSWPSTINLNTPIAINNTACGTMVFGSAMSIQNATTIQNNGTMIFQSSFETSNGASVDNRGKFIVVGNTKIGGPFKNQWQAVFKGSSHTFNAGDSIINLYTMVFNGSAIGAPRIRNEGLLWFAGAFQYNGGGGIKMNRGNAQLRVGGSFINGGGVVGTGNIYVDGGFANQASLTGISASQPLYLNKTGGGNVSNYTNTQVNAAMPAGDTTAFVGGAGNPDISCLTLLPMVLSAFKGVVVDGGVDLSWTTLTEANGDRFEVEYSTDGISYKQAGTVAAKGNAAAATNYQYRYTGPMYPVLYFRLLLVDRDGSREYSAVVTVRTSVRQSVTASIFPNPFAEQLTIQVALPKPAKVTVRLLDMNGRVLKSEDHAGQAGFNQWPMKGLAELRKGLYLLEINAGEELWMQKIIK